MVGGSPQVCAVPIIGRGAARKPGVVRRNRRQIVRGLDMNATRERIERLGFDVRTAVQNDMTEAQVREYFTRDVERIWPGTTSEPGYDVEALTVAALRLMTEISDDES